MKSKYHMTSIDVAEESELNKRYTRIKRSKENESGRSMVEMLGVLALMGVLAIGGIMGYRWAMTKYQANETFNELRRRVVVHSQQSIVGSPLTQVELGDKTQLGYPITVTGIEGGFFELTISGLEKDLCREMVRTGWILPVQTRVNGVVSGTNEELCGETNELVFRFQTEMGGCKTDSDCLCGTCTNGKCVSTCGSGESCVKNFDDGQYVCCPSGNINGSFCCETVNEKGECCDSDGKCCPPDKPLMDANGKCWACDDTKRHIRLAESATSEPPQEVINRCLRCSNRKYYMGYVPVCSLPCPPEKPLMDYRKQDCYACDDEIELTTSWYTNDSENSMNQLCRICPNRTVTHDIVNICRLCEQDSEPFSVKNKADCDRCPERIYIGTGDGHYCAWPCENPNDIMSGVGKCYACDVPERIDTRGVYQADGSRYPTDLGECQKCYGQRFLGSCRNDTAPTCDPNWSTSCYSCDSDVQYVYLGSYAGSDYSALCEACGNRRSFNHYCAKYCTDGKIWDNVGQCHTCGEPQDFSVKGVPENKCACPGVRYLDGDICKKCPTDVSSLTPEQQAQCSG